MSYDIALLNLRLKEIVRTWRIWVLPTVMVFLAISGAVLARYINEIIGSAISADGITGVELNEPIALDAYAQWTKNLTQIAVLIAIVMGAGAINSEIRSGAAAILLVKPISRSAYVVTHMTAILLLVAFSAFLGATAAWLTTVLVFGEADPGPVFAATGVWMVLAAVLITASLLASAAINTMAGAAGIGIGVFFLLVILGIVPWLSKFTPAGLITITNAIASGKQQADNSLWWPIITGMALSGLLLGAAILVFRRREI